MPLPPIQTDLPGAGERRHRRVGEQCGVKWYGGPWAHKYDVLLGTDPNNLEPLLVDTELGPSQSATQSIRIHRDQPAPGTTYYWQVVSRTMANLSRAGNVWSFTTAGTAAPPPPSGPVRRPETSCSTPWMDGLRVTNGRRSRDSPRPAESGCGT